MAIRRKVVIPVDTLLSIIKDYRRESGEIPEDAIPVSLQIKPTEQGLFGLMVQSPSFTDDRPVRIVFDIKRTHAVG